MRATSSIISHIPKTTIYRVEEIAAASAIAKADKIEEGIALQLFRAIDPEKFLRWPHHLSITDDGRF